MIDMITSWKFETFEPFREPIRIRPLKMDHLVLNIISLLSCRAVELEIAGCGGGSSSTQDFLDVFVLLPSKIKRYRMKAVCFVNVVKCCFFFNCINTRLGIEYLKQGIRQEIRKCYIICLVDTGKLNVTAACELHNRIVLTIQSACRNFMVHFVTTSKDSGSYLPQNYET